MMIDTKTLRPGDEVAIWLSGRGITCRYEIATVKTVTPTGRVKLTDGRQFTAENNLMGDKKFGFNSDYLCFATKEIRKEIADSSSIEIIRKFTHHYDTSSWATLPTEALRQIAGIIAEHAGGATHAR